MVSVKDNVSKKHPMVQYKETKARDARNSINAILDILFPND
jgi:hypothetical protein